MKSVESIGSLANKYDVKVSEIIELNKLKRKELWLNETIKIPLLSALALSSDLGFSSTFLPLPLSGILMVSFNQSSFVSVYLTQ